MPLASPQQNRTLAVSTLDALLAVPALSLTFSHMNLVNTELAVHHLKYRQPMPQLFRDSLHNHLYRKAWLQAKFHLQEYLELEYSSSKFCKTMQISSRGIVLGLLSSLHPTFRRHLQDFASPPLPKIIQGDAGEDELSDSFVAYLQILNAEESARRADRDPQSSYVRIDERVEYLRRHFFPPVPDPFDLCQTSLEKTFLSTGLAILEHLTILHTCACELLESEQDKGVSVPVQPSSAINGEYRDRKADLGRLRSANLSLHKSIEKLQSFLTYLIIVRLVVEVDQASTISLGSSRTSLSSCQDLFSRCCDESRGEANRNRLQMMLEFFVNMEKTLQQLTQTHSDSTRMPSSNNAGSSDVSASQLAMVLQFPGALDMFVRCFTRAHYLAKEDEAGNGDLSKKSFKSVSRRNGSRHITSTATRTRTSEPSCVRSTALTDSGRNIPHLHIQLPIDAEECALPIVSDDQRDCSQQGHDRHVDS